MRSLNNVVVVGGGAAGVAAAETLRRQGYERSLLLLGEEHALPYDRPPLSKQVLIGDWDDDQIHLRDEKHYQDLGIELRHARAVNLDPDDRRIQLADGTSLDFDGVVIATGVRPRLLPGRAQPSGMHVLRDHADVVGLRSDLLASSRLVIVGAGVLGMEVAASAQAIGLDVTVLDPLAQPMIRQVGPEIGAHIACLHRDRGITLRLGVGVDEIVCDDDRVTAVSLSDGTVVPTDCVLVAIGAVPAVEWLRGSGLPIGDGVECDEYCAAAPGVYAAGDVASWFNPRYGQRMRVEHRMNAGAQGAAAARNLLHGNVEPFAPLPYFWTDQYDVKIQFHGIATEHSEVTVEEGSPSDDQFVALYRTNGRATGVLGWNAPARLMRYRKILLDDEAEAA